MVGWALRSKTLFELNVTENGQGNGKGAEGSHTSYRIVEVMRRELAGTKAGDRSEENDEDQKHTRIPKRQADCCFLLRFNFRAHGKSLPNANDVPWRSAGPPLALASGSAFSLANPFS